MEQTLENHSLYRPLINQLTKVFFFFKDFFLSRFRFLAELRGQYGDLPYIPCPDITSPNINISDQSGTFVTVDEPILIHHYHTKSIVHISELGVYILWIWTNEWHVSTLLVSYRISLPSFLPPFLSFPFLPSFLLLLFFK